MKYFSDFMNIDELRKMYKEYCLAMHPDKGGLHEEFCEMKNEYDVVLGRCAASEAGTANREGRAAKFNFESEHEIAEMIAKLMTIPGIDIELTGSWLWITGNTHAVYERIKAAGITKYSKTKGWYWSPYMSTKRRRSRYSMDKIRDTFGSQKFSSSAKEKLLTA